jgi:hypothetical protein
MSNVMSNRFSSITVTKPPRPLGRTTALVAASPKAGAAGWMLTALTTKTLGELAKPAMTEANSELEQVKVIS